MRPGAGHQMSPLAAHVCPGPQAEASTQLAGRKQANRQRTPGLASLGEGRAGLQTCRFRQLRIICIASEEPSRLGAASQLCHPLKSPMCSATPNKDPQTHSDRYGCAGSLESWCDSYGQLCPRSSLDAYTRVYP